MDREIPVANRYIDRKMQELRNKKHRQTLNQIRKKHHSYFQTSMYNEPNKNSRVSGAFAENKNLEIQKQNILLFNKIASIIREKPKGAPSRTYTTSSQDATLKHKKQQERLKTENQRFEKRLSNQKPTIQNTLLYKDRKQNLRYLKFIGRYPYEGNKKLAEGTQCLDSHTCIRSMRSVSESHLPVDIEVYRKKTEEFLIRITKISDSYFVFEITKFESEKSYQYTMNKSSFEDQLSKCGYSYEKLVGKLRLAKNQKIIFDFQ